MSSTSIVPFSLVLVVLAAGVFANPVPSRQHLLTTKLLSNLEALEAVLLRREAARERSGQLGPDEIEAMKEKNLGEIPQLQQLPAVDNSISFSQLERRDAEEGMPTSNLDSREEAEVQRINQMIADTEGRPFVVKRGVEDDDDDDDNVVGDDSGRLRRLRELRRALGKRNYNLDHLARMNFRRSYRATSSLNNRHILGGLKKRATFNNNHILGGLKRSSSYNDRHILGGLRKRSTSYNEENISRGLNRRGALNSRHILGGL